MYYEHMCNKALQLGSLASFVSITSYNEWGEGTQIEAAVPRSKPPLRMSGARGGRYLDYEPHAPDHITLLFGKRAKSIDGRVLTLTLTLTT